MPPLDHIHFRDMAFYGFHGNLDAESQLGQKFLVDLTLGLDLRPAGRSDALADTVDYAAVFSQVKAVMEHERHHLLEALAERLCATLFDGFPPVQTIRLQLKKPEAPIPGIFGHVAIEIERRRPA